MRSRPGAPRKLCASESHLSYGDALIHIVYIMTGRADEQRWSHDPSWYARWSRLTGAIPWARARAQVILLSSPSSHTESAPYVGEMSESVQHIRLARDTFRPAGHRGI